MKNAQELLALLREIARGAAEGAGEDSMVEMVLERGCRLVPCDGLLVVATDADPERFRVQAVETDVPAIAALAGRTYRRAGALEERALREGTQVVHAGADIEPGTVLDALTRAVRVETVVISAFRTRALGSGTLIATNPRLEAEVAAALVESMAALMALAVTGTARLLGESSAGEASGLDEVAVAKLARSHRLAALGELAAGVAHDLNNALNPIVSFAQLIRDDPATPAHVRTYAQRVLMAATDGAETVRRIQGFTSRRRGEGRRRETVAIASAAQEAIELSRPTWAERLEGGAVDLTLSVEEDLHAAATASEVREALLNLINNALDAMRAGGTLRIIGRREPGWVLLAVQDTGTGMTEPVRAMALQPFFTTKGARGTGLGLSEVAAIARRHGGVVEIESWPAVGTTVLLRLPAAAPAHETAEEAPLAPVEAVGSQRVLLVDDNVLNAEAIAASLRAAGHDVTIADTGEAGIALFERARYDVVIADLGLPGIGGYDLIRELHQRRPEVRLGVVTGWSLDSDPEELTSRGVSFWLAKPVNPSDLLAAIARPGA